MDKRRNCQLYDYIDKLSSKINDESNLGLLIGYSIAKSLIGFNPIIYGREPRSFKEIWAVYDGLSDVTDSLKENAVSTELVRLKQGVNARLIEGITMQETVNKESVLLEKMISSAKQKNIPLEEFLKLSGETILKETMSKGYLNHAISRVYDIDYKQIMNTFS
jgi:hypothetical protein